MCIAGPSLAFFMVQVWPSCAKNNNSMQRSAQALIGKEKRTKINSLIPVFYVKGCLSIVRSLPQSPGKTFFVCRGILAWEVCWDIQTCWGVQKGLYINIGASQICEPHEDGVPFCLLSITCNWQAVRYLPNDFQAILSSIVSRSGCKKSGRIDCIDRRSGSGNVCP